ncbi:unnamed protein product [Calypogeia fissa]
MAATTFNLASWNVRGLCSPNRKWMVRNWIQQVKTPLHAVALQEIKADAFRLDVALRTILPDYHHLSSAPDLGKGGTALLIHPDFTLRNSGSLSHGRAVWAQLEKDGEVFGILSVYGPNSPRLRALMWHELKQALPRDNWLICGDFNMTERPEDTTGGHNLLRGRELEAWRLFVLKHDLKDALSEMGTVTGSHFTWRRRRGTHLEQSKIDRIYLGEKGWWLGSLTELVHDSGQALSDHDPVILRAVLNQPPSPSPARYYTYFKACSSVLKSPENMLCLQKAWESSSGVVSCPHRRWEAACRRLKSTYIQLQNEPKSGEEHSRVLKENLRELKAELVEDFTAEALEDFSEKEQQLRDMEEAHALHLRQLSRIRWLGQGDEPSRFFFRTLHAKQKRESMTKLLLDDDTLLTSPQWIQEEVTHQCQQLFAPEESTEADSLAQQEACRKLLRGTKFSFTAAEKVFLEAAPTAQELRDVLNLFPKDKAPGIDGFTAEVFRACWDFISSDMLAMVLDFWNIGQIAQTIKEGVLKLIPQKADKRRFKDWRPLTMLTIMYKILAKLLALRIKLFLPRMISPQQTGFIPGRNILENVSMSWLTMDWIRAKKFPALFLKLDFEKAFDRVRHEYLWATLSKLGFSPKFIS